MTDEAGKPVAGAHVYVSSVGPAGRQKGPHTAIFGSIKAKMSTETAADGRWVIGNLPPTGTASVILEDPRFAGAGVQIELGPGASAAPPLVAISGGVIVGRAIMEGDGPSKDISVFAQGGTDTSRGYCEAQTSADGAYRLAPLPAGTYNVMVDDKSGRWVAVAIQGLEVGKGQTVTAPDLVLTAGAIVEGTVTDSATGQPLANAIIGSYGPHRPRSSQAVSNTHTDAAGSFRLRVAPGESYIYLMGVPEGYLRGEQNTTVNLAAGQTKRVNFKATKGLIVTGAVVDEQGRPQPSAQIVIAGTYESGDRENWLSPRPDGTFNLSGLGTGSHTVHGQGDWMVISPKEVTLPLSGELRIVVRKLTPIPLTGRVVTKAGVPVEGVKIQLMVITPTGIAGGGIGEQQDIVTDPQGRFSLPAVRPDATIQLSATKEGYTFATGGQVDKQEDGFHVSDIVFTPLASSLSGAVVDAQGKPIVGAKVMSPEGAPGPWAVTDTQGQFSLQGMATGEVRVLAAHGGDFGQARAVVPGAPVSVRLAPMKPAEDHDVLRAFALLSEVWRKSKGADYYARENLPGEIAPYDPDLALRLVQGTEGQSHDYAVMMAIYALAETDPARALAWAQPRLPQIADPTVRAIALGELGLAVAETKPEAAKELYRQLKDLLGPIFPDKSDLFNLMAQSQRVALAARLKEPDASAVLKDLIATTKEVLEKQGGQDRGLLEAMIAGAAKGSPEMADQGPRGLQPHRLASRLRASTRDRVPRHLCPRSRPSPLLEDAGPVRGPPGHGLALLRGRGQSRDPGDRQD